MRPFARDSALAVAVGAATVLPGFLVGALSLQIRADLDANLAAVGAGVTVFFAAGAVSAGPLGRVTERVGALKSMRAALLVSGGALLLIAALATSLASLLALLVVAGLANGAAQPAINLFMAEEVALERQGLAFGIKQSAIPAATTISGIALPVLALTLGWRYAFAACGVLAFCVVPAIRRRSRVPPRASNAIERRSLGLTPSLLLLAVGAACASFGPGAVAAYLVATSVDAGVAEGTAGTLLALGSASTFLTRITLGIRADRVSDYSFRPVVVLLASGSIGLALLATGEQAPLFVGVFFAFTLGWGWPGLFNVAVVDRYRIAPAAATGVTQAGIYVGAAGGPATFGLLSHAFGYSTAWAVTAGVMVVAASVVAMAQTRFGSRETGTTP